VESALNIKMAGITETVVAATMLEVREDNTLFWLANANVKI
jgi:hypothetical protein